MKSLLRYLIIVPLLLVSITGRADAISFDADGLEYKLLSAQDMTCALVGTKEAARSMDSIIIPATVSFRGRDIKVVKIDGWAFEYCNARYIVIGANIREIEPSAFRGCSYLFAISVPTNCRSEVSRYFDNFGGFTPFRDNQGALYIKRDEAYSFTQNSLNYVVAAGWDRELYHGQQVGALVEELSDENFSGGVIIPDYVSVFGRQIPVLAIDEGAFENSKIKAVTIGNKVIVIGEDAFKNATLLENIWFGSGIEKIYDEAFYGTAFSKNALIISVPASCWRIGNEAFGHRALQERRLLVVHQADDYDTRSIIRTCLHLGKKFLTPSLYNSASGGIMFADDVKQIPSCNDSNWNVEIKELFIGKEARTVGDLSRLNIKDGGCIYLSAPAPPTATGFNENTYVMTTLKVPVGCAELYKNAPIWKKFWVIEEWDVTKSSAFISSLNGKQFEDHGFKYQITSLDDLTCSVLGMSGYMSYPVIPSNVSYYGLDFKVTRIENRAFYQKDVQTVSFGDNITEIGDEAFAQTRYLESVNTGQGVSSIGYRTFYNSKLKSITIGDNVTEIGTEAFAETSSLESVAFGRRVSSIGERAFYNSAFIRNTKDICVPGSCRALGNGAFGSGRTVVVHETFLFQPQSIGQRSIHLGKHFLTSDIYKMADSGIVFADDVKHVPSYTLSSDKIVVPSFIIGSGAIEVGNLSGIEIKNGGKLYLRATRPPSAAGFNENTYVQTVLKVPKGCAESYKNADVWKQFSVIEEWDVQEYDSLVDSIEESCFTFGGFRYEILSLDEKTCSLVSYESLDSQDLEISAYAPYMGKLFKVEKVGDRAFYRSKIQSVSFGINVKEIGEEAFAETAYLRTIVFNPSITTIGNRAFFNSNYALNTKDICLPGSCRFLGADAFGGSPMREEEEVVGVEEEEIPFMLVEDPPSFMGGTTDEFSAWVAQHIVYPEIAKENCVSGKVITQFTIATDGSVTKVKVVRGVDPALDAEAIRVIKSSPKWTPGKQRGRPVKVSYTFPVVFQLR